MSLATHVAVCVPDKTCEVGVSRTAGNNGIREYEYVSTLCAYSAVGVLDLVEGEGSSGEDVSRCRLQLCYFFITSRLHMLVSRPAVSV